MNPAAEDILPPALIDRVLARLGFLDLPTADLPGLRALYRAWCVHVPFDNVRKMIALRSTGAILPGGHAAEFFEAWLAHGTGGTCWPTSNALYALVRSLGFDARRITGAMRDLGVANHGSVAVSVERREWLVDSSMLTNAPLPLDDDLFVSDDRVFAAEVEQASGAVVVWCDMPPNPEYLPCRLDTAPATHADYLAAYERSRERSPFNQRLYVRRNRESEMMILFGNVRYVKTPDGLSRRELSRNELREALRANGGFSDEIIERWIHCGALEASFAAPSGGPPPPVTGKPPSQRTK